MKKLNKISYWISWGSVINLGVMTMIATIIHTLYWFGCASYTLDVVAITLLVSSMILVGVAISLSIRINEWINEIRMQKESRNS